MGSWTPEVGCGERERGRRRVTLSIVLVEKGLESLLLF
jgi:hypothetical protein